MEKLDKNKTNTKYEMPVLIKPDIEYKNKSKIKAYKNKLLKNKSLLKEHSDLTLFHCNNNKVENKCKKSDFSQLTTKINIEKYTQNFNENVQSSKCKNKYKNKFSFSQDTSSLKNIEPIIDRRLGRKKFRTPLKLSNSHKKMKPFDESNTFSTQLISKKNIGDMNTRKYKQEIAKNFNKKEDKKLNELNLTENNNMMHISQYSSKCERKRKTEEYDRVQPFKINYYSKYIDRNTLKNTALKSEIESKDESQVNKVDWLTNSSNHLHILQNCSFPKVIETNNSTRKENHFDKVVPIGENTNETVHIENLKNNPTEYSRSENNNENSNNNNYKINTIIFVNASTQTDKITQIDFKLDNNPKQIKPIENNELDQLECFSTMNNIESLLNTNSKRESNNNTQNKTNVDKFQNSKNCNKNTDVKILHSSILKLKKKPSNATFDSKIEIQPMQKSSAVKQMVIDKFLIKNPNQNELEHSNVIQKQIKIENDISDEKSCNTITNSKKISCNEHLTKINLNCIDLNTIISAETNPNDNIKEIEHAPLQVASLSSDESSLRELELYEVNYSQLMNEENNTNVTLKKENINNLKNVSKRRETNLYNTSHDDIKNDNNYDLKKFPQLEKFSISKSSDPEYEYKELRIQKWLQDICNESIKDNESIKNNESIKDNESIKNNESIKDNENHRTTFSNSNVNDFNDEYLSDIRLKEENDVYVNEQFFDQHFEEIIL